MVADTQRPRRWWVTFAGQCKELDKSVPAGEPVRGDLSRPCGWAQEGGQGFLGCDVEVDHAVPVFCA